MTTKRKMTEERNKQDLAAFARRLNEVANDLGAPTKGRGRQRWAVEFYGRTLKAVRRWLEGEGWPQREDWEDIAAKSNVRLEWLFFGLGPKKHIVGQIHGGLDRQLMTQVLHAVDEAFEEHGVAVKKDVRTTVAMLIYEQLTH